MENQINIIENIFNDIFQILADADIQYEVEPELGNPVVHDIFNRVCAMKNKYKQP